MLRIEKQKIYPYMDYCEKKKKTSVCPLDLLRMLFQIELRRIPAAQFVLHTS